MRATLLLISISALWLTGCGEPPKTQADAPAAPVAVETVAAAAEQWPSLYEASGTVRARMAATVSAKVMGYVREVNFQVGDRVREGQLLVTVDARDLEANVRRAGAGVDEATAGVPEAESAVAAAQAQLHLAEVTFARMNDLFQKKSISNQEFDEAEARLKAARANHEMARARLTQLRARIAQANEERGAAEIMRGYARLTAPFAGVITAKSVEPGNLATPGAPLATIEREGNYRLEVPVDESRAGSIQVGQKAGVEFDGERMDARVSEIVPAVDAASRSYIVKLDLPARAALRSGMFGRASFALGARQVLAVPAAAVAERGQLQSVMVAANGVARTRLITLGDKRGGRVAVLSGLTEGERVIAPAPPNLADGARVEVRP